MFKKNNKNNKNNKIDKEEMQNKSINDDENFSRYHSAVLAWDERVGQGKRQLNNWRLCALISFFVTLLLIIALIVTSSITQPKVYVAKVGPKDNVQSVRLASVPVAANEVQKVYFVGEFIHNIMTIPIDPVILRNNWLKAYQMSMGKAQLTLTDFIRDNNPFGRVGEITETIKIESFNPVTENSFQIIWRQNSFNQNGKTITYKRYSGIFTVQQFKPSNNLQELLVNPFGLKIIYFSINRLGSVGQ